MADTFRIIPYVVRSAGTDVPPEEVQAAINSLAQQTTIALNSVASDPTGPAGGDLSGTYPNPTVAAVHATSGTMSGVTINSSPIGQTTPAAGAFTTLTATTPVTPTSGGTGRNALTANAVLIGEGSSQVNFAAPGAAGTLLASNGVAADPTFQTSASLGLAPLASPAFTGTPTAPTAAAHTNTTQLATTAFVETEFASPPVAGIGSVTPSPGAFTTLTATTPVGVPSGGTGRATLTNHGVLIGAGTAAITQSAVGTTGQALIGQTGADPVFGFPTGALIGVQVITSTQTYTPTAGTNSVVVELQAAGGGSGGIAATAAATTSASTGSGAGAYAKVRFTTGFSGVTVTIGAAGTAGTATPTAGGTAAASSFGALISCPGGIATGVGPASSTAGGMTAGAAQTAAPTISGGTTIVSIAGAGTSPSFLLSTAQSFTSNGASCPLGIGGSAQNTTTMAATQGSGFGAGASSAVNGNSQAAQAGAAGRPAVCVVYEYA